MVSARVPSRSARAILLSPEQKGVETTAIAFTLARSSADGTELFTAMRNVICAIYTGAAKYKHYSPFEYLEVLTLSLP